MPARSAASRSSAKASVAGGEEDDGSGDHEGEGKQSVDNETNKQIELRRQEGHREGHDNAKGTGGATSDQASTSEGPVSVAGAVAVNIETASAQAFIPDHRHVTAGGTLTVKSAANADGHAIADGSATTGEGGTGVGVGGVR